MVRHRILIPAFRRFESCYPSYGPLAQLVEHLTFNQVVRGSTPRRLMCRGKPFGLPFFHAKNGSALSAAAPFSQSGTLGLAVRLQARVTTPSRRYHPLGNPAPTALLLSDNCIRQAFFNVCANEAGSRTLRGQGAADFERGSVQAKLWGETRNQRAITRWWVSQRERSARSPTAHVSRQAFWLAVFSCKKRQRFVGCRSFFPIGHAWFGGTLASARNNAKPALPPAWEPCAYGAAVVR